MFISEVLESVKYSNSKKIHTDLINFVSLRFLVNSYAQKTVVRHEDFQFRFVVCDLNLNKYIPKMMYTIFKKFALNFF